MTQKAIQRGDTVTVVMARKNVFPWQEGNHEFEAGLVRVPAGEGDTFAFRVNDEYTVELNGNSSELVGFYKKHQEDEE